MAPERLLGVRDDPRSDLFSLGVLLYFFTTGERPFGESETLRGMKRRLWRDPTPPRKLRPDYPLWLQEIVLRCLEIEPVWRHPTAAQLAFDLGHPDQVKLTVLSGSRFNGNIMQPKAKADLAAQLDSSPIVAIALDTTEAAAELNDALRVTAGRILATLPGARLACLNVLRLNRLAVDRTLDENQNNKHVDRLVMLKHWAQPLKLDPNRLTTHVLEAIDPAAASTSSMPRNARPMSSNGRWAPPAPIGGNHPAAQGIRAGGIDRVLAKAVLAGLINHPTEIARRLAVGRGQDRGAGLAPYAHHVAAGIQPTTVVAAHVAAGRGEFWAHIGRDDLGRFRRGVGIGV
eukprot:gene5590-7578_t